MTSFSKASWLMLSLGAFFVILGPLPTGAYPQPCRFARQYEGHRFQSSYFDVKHDYVAVDCDRKLMYTRSVGEKEENSFTIVNLATNVMYIFNQGRECIETAGRPFELINYCENSRDATFTGEMTLEGKVRQGWVTTNPQHYEQTTVVTPSKKSGEGCLPFLFRVRTDRHTLMANTFYDVKTGISDTDVVDRFDVDTLECARYGYV
ncbi:hypothetical protein ElyMa_005920200 [Elysia marginata]|uniref:Uncharacterized protein n=1 Tax=Elysia marginata TaxID=1093978 RepID=A0AAV4G7Y2_9GAST|nr:hypothetical protein ElyMa_005920200 [Elysia marginata]